MELAREDGSEILVGDRLSIEGHLGTVRFTGEIPSTKGDWIGIEWDDPSRGKHDGKHGDVNYFKTSHPTGGSFIRPKKANGGVSCYSAVQDRYGIVDDENSGVIVDELFVMDNKKKRTVVEMVGAKSVNLKQSQLNKLTEIALRDMSVYGVGPHSKELQNRLTNVTELDLSRNLLSSWENVGNITKCLPRLQHLNVSDNKLTLPDNTTNLKPSFESITVLYANRLGYTWQEFLTVCSMFPSLEQLHICFNNLQCLGPLPPDRFQMLQLLNLESNNIQSWTEILHFGKLPRLDTLLLIGNQIDTIEFQDAQVNEKTQNFPLLKTIYLNHNKISKWTSINELNKLRSLEELRISHNPLMEKDTAETSRQLTVAKISNLKFCNRTEVMDDERKGAEFDYLKKFGRLWIESGGNQDANKSNPSADFILQHPRYDKLVKVYGPPENSEMEQKPKTLKDSLITLNLSSPYIPDKGTLQKKVPSTMTVIKLKALVKRLFKLDVEEINLTYKSHKNPNFPEIEFENELREMSFYGVESGDTILIRYR